MHIIIGLVLAAFALWLWLSAHWFGRVLAFLVTGPAAILLAVSNGTPWGALGLLNVLGPIAWIVASAPIYLARHRAKAPTDAPSVVPNPDR